MSHDEARQRDLLPEEKVAGSEDPGAETAAILEESEQRAEQRADGPVPDADLSYAQTVLVACSAQTLYDLVSDITRMGEWSPVCRWCRWEGAERGAGGWFTGHNETPEREWETRSLVVAADPGREFTFVVGGDRVRWSYTFLPVEGGTELTESWAFLPAGRAAFDERYGPDAPAQVRNRMEAARSGIPATLAAIKRAAEA